MTRQRSCRTRPTEGRHAHAPTRPEHRSLREQYQHVSVIADPSRRLPKDIPAIEELLQGFRYWEYPEARTSDRNLCDRDVQALLRDLSNLPTYATPPLLSALDSAPHAKTRRRNDFSFQQRTAYIELSRNRCEVRQCRTRGRSGFTDPRPGLVVHHVRFVRDDGRATSSNAEVVCIDCHRGAHGLLTFFPPTHELRCGNPNDAIVVSGIPITTMFEVTARFERAGILKLRPLTRPLKDLWDACPIEVADRPTVYDHAISGDGLRNFRDCQDLLRRIALTPLTRRVRTRDGVRTFTSPLAGRLTRRATDLILSFVESRFIAPLCVSLRAA